MDSRQYKDNPARPINIYEEVLRNLCGVTDERVHVTVTLQLPSAIVRTIDKMVESYKDEDCTLREMIEDVIIIGLGSSARFAKDIIAADSKDPKTIH
jgi:hypothetical protein